MVVINEQTQDINRGRYIVAKTMAEKQENSRISQTEGIRGGNLTEK